MIKVEINRVNNKIVSFTLSGHADFDEEGKDIVCAGVSAVVFGTVNSLEALCSYVPITEVEDAGGYLYCSIPEEISEEQQAKTQLLLESMLVSLETIREGYGNYIRMKQHNRR